MTPNKIPQEIEKDKWKENWLMIAVFLWELGVGLLIGSFIGGILK